MSTGSRGSSYDYGIRYPGAHDLPAANYNLLNY